VIYYSVKFGPCKLLPLAKQGEKDAEVAQAHLGQLYLRLR